MIVQFSIENYLSFKELNTLSMVTSALKEDETLTRNVTIPVGDTASSLLKSAVIFGPNASGKSNVIKAFDFFKQFIVNSFKNLQAGEDIDVENFRLDSEYALEPTTMELVYFSGVYLYRYGFTVSKEKVENEWLCRRAAKKRAKEVELFRKEGNDAQVHASMSLVQDIVNKKMVRPNALILSAAAQFNDPTAVEIIRWLDDTSVIFCSDDERNWKDALRHFDDVSVRERLVEFSKYADLGIEDIAKSGEQVVSRHNQYDGDGNITKSVTFPFLDSESEGTIKYFSLAFPVIDALDHGKRLIVDEFDSKLHPLLTQKILSLFGAKETNPYGAQLIFTAHDSNLLSSGEFRRDQIWFTQKDRMGASELFSLAEYKVRSNAALEKSYLAGKYGATPIIGDLSGVFIKEI